MKPETFVKALKQFARFFENLTEAELEALERGEKHILIELSTIRKSKESRSLPKNFSDLVEALQKLNSREEAENLLKGLKKVDLVAISSELDLPVYKSENALRIKERIIESTIGFKLQSQAIQKSSN